MPLVPDGGGIASATTRRRQEAAGRERAGVCRRARRCLAKLPAPCLGADRARARYEWLLHPHRCAVDEQHAGFV